MSRAAAATPLLKTVTLDRIEKDESGVLFIRMGMSKLQDGKHTWQWHRTTITPGTNAELQMAAVNAHLNQMGFPALSDDAVQHILDVVKENHTLGVIAAYAAEQQEHAANI